MENFFLRLRGKIQDDKRFLVLYALLLELLVIGYATFLGLFTLEILLPTFISGKLSLVKFLMFFLALTFITVGLGRILDQGFVVSERPISRLIFWGASLWLLGILVLAFLKFPFWALPVVVASFLLVCFLLFSLFQEERRR